MIVLRNSPCQHLRKCRKNSMENVHTDVRVERVKTPPKNIFTLRMLDVQSRLEKFKKKEDGHACAER